MDRDVVVIGAGPAGTAAAIELSNSGLSTLLIDKSDFPRDKCCGDGLTASALRQLELLEFEPSTTPSWNWIDSAKIRSTSSRVVTLGFPNNGRHYAAVARRFDFDDALLRHAVSRGAEFLPRTTMTSVLAISRSQIEVSLSNGESVRAKRIIAADGVYSSTRKTVGLTRNEGVGDWHAFRQYFPRTNDMKDREIYVSFESDLIPAYFWNFPLADGSSNIGFGIHTGSINRLGGMAEMWRDIQTRNHLATFFQTESDERLKAWPIPANVRRQSLTHGPIFFVGDAASSSDPLTGEGIGQALETGRLAALAIIGNFGADSSASALTYERSVRDSLFADDKWSRALMRGLSHRKGTRFGVRVAGASPFLSQLMARWMFEDFHRSEILTPRALLSKGTGAY